MNSTNVPISEVNTAASVRTCIIQVNESLTMVACLLHEEMHGKKLALYRRNAVQQSFGLQILAVFEAIRGKNGYE